MSFIYDNMFLFIFLFLIILIFLVGCILHTLDRIKEEKLPPTDIVVNLCKSFEMDDWDFEYYRKGENTSLGYLIRECILVNNEKDLKIFVRFHTNNYGNIDYTPYNIKIKAPWLTEIDQKNVVKYFCENKVLDTLIYPEIKALK